MSSSKSDLTVYDRIQHVETELRTLANDVLQDEKARKMLMGVSQQAINTLELGPDAIWRILMQVCQYKSKLPLSSLLDKLAPQVCSSRTLP